MKLRIMAAAVLGTALVATTGISVSERASATELPGAGMCNGRADANLLVIAHARASGDLPKFIVNVSTDANAVATGSLILGQGPDHIVVTDLCRVWQHSPESEPKCGEPYPEGATTAHVVGLTTRRDGTPLLVRADVRQTDEGKFFRVRYRPLTEEHELVSAMEGDSCEDESWTRVPPEEWAPLDQLMVRSSG